MDRYRDLLDQQQLPDQDYSWDYAGFGSRSLAFIIDLVVVGIFSAGIMVIGFLLMDASAQFVGYEPEIIFLLYLLMLAGRAAYFILMESGRHQGTLGKMALGIKVVGERGGKISVRRATGRYFARILSAILSIGYLMAALTERSQGLHDIICTTYVIKR